MSHRVEWMVRLGTLAGLLIAGAACGQEAAAERAAVESLSRRIDAYVAKRCVDAGVTLAPRAADAVYFRRLNLDLAGRIPSLLDVHDFLENQDSDKRWEWVERFLAADSYPRHFAAIWRTILLGNVSSPQLQFLTPNFEFWLREELRKNAGLDAMTRAVLTGSGAPGRGGLRANAAAFYAANENKAENLAGATARVFLGVKLDCAQCHAHPFAPWTREQFWEFAAFFSGVQPGVRRLGLQAPMPGNGREIQIPKTSKTVKARFLTGAEPKWEDGSDSRQVLADWVTAADNPYFARAMADHLWTYLMGVSLLEPIQEPGTDGRISHPELLDLLARELSAHRFDLKFLVRAIVHSDTYQRSSSGSGTPEDLQLFARRPLRGLTPEQIFDSVAEATAYRNDNEPAINAPFFQVGNQPRSPRTQFLTKFLAQDFKDEPQTSILQALFLMNGKFLAERTRLENSESLQVLARQPTGTVKKVETLYLMVLSRLPRPEEAERMVRYVERDGPARDAGQNLSDVYWALLNSAEFLLNH